MRTISPIVLTLLSILILACSAGSKLSQEELETKKYQEVYGLLDVSEVKEKPDQMPQYPKGNGGLIADIQKYQSYPKEAIDKEIEGNVIVGFTVAKNGELKDIAIEKSVHPTLDSASVQIMNKLQPWYPAYTDGEPVPVRLKTLVTFRLPIIKETGITQ